jgi:hypothetical protein
MNRNARRLDRLIDWTLDRQWTQRVSLDRPAVADPDWQRIASELNTLADAITDEPPATFKLHPRLALLYSRKLGMTPDAYRREVWQQHAAMQTPAGRRLYRELQAIEARYAAGQGRQS